MTVMEAMRIRYGIITGQHDYREKTMSISRKDCDVAKWSMLRKFCFTLFEAGRSNIYVYAVTLLDLDDISKLRDDYEREKIKKGIKNE